jgi:hypothetical protein
VIGAACRSLAARFVALVHAGGVRLEPVEA